MRQEFYDARALAIMEVAENGATITETAEMLNLCVPTVRKYARKYNIAFLSGTEGLALRLLRLSADGKSGMEAAEVVGRTYVCVMAVARKFGFGFSRPGTGPANPDRAAAMEAMYRGGKTLEEVGAVYGVTRERVRQILRKYQNTTKEEGGSIVRAKILREKARAKKEAACWSEYGCSLENFDRLKKLGDEMKAGGATRYQTPIGAFRNQRRNAASRGIEWRITLAEWWDAWERSGHWNERGRGQGYVMCRFQDNGAYEIGNVYIATAVHNSTVQPNNPFRKTHPDFPTARANFIEKIREGRAAA